MSVEESCVRDLKILEQCYFEKVYWLDNVQLKKFKWICVKVLMGEGYNVIKKIMCEYNFVMVCEEVVCLNVGECWFQGYVIMMIMGEVCICVCIFCNIVIGKLFEDLDLFESG